MVSSMARRLMARWVRRSVVVMVAVLSLLPLAARAEMKIGYFDVKRILSEVEEAKDQRDRLQSEFAKKQKELDSLKTEIDNMQKEYQAKQGVLSPSAREDLQAKMQDKVVKAQQRYMELQQELAGKEQQALSDLLSKLEPVVQEIANAEGYTYVFEKNESGLFYAPSQHDLTAQLIRKYNQRFPSKKASKSGKGG
jgi:outer membrane protein